MYFTIINNMNIFNILNILHRILLIIVLIKGSMNSDKNEWKEAINFAHNNLIINFL